MVNRFWIGFLFLLVLAMGCKKDTTTTAEPYLIFKMKLDPNQTRLDNLGNPAGVPAGHAAQNPTNFMISAHYIEMAQGALTQLGAGEVLFLADEVTQGADRGIDFDKNTKVKDGEVYYKVKIKDVTPGEYEYLRVSLAYQNYDVKFYLDTTITVGGTNYPIQQEFPCNIASFVGYNTYINAYTLKNQSVTVNGFRKQGYWGAEAYGTIYGFPFDQVNTGQAPPGATTVVNPLFATSPIPAGSCVATGKFLPGKLSITGKETKDIVIETSLSLNKSFEWTEVVADGKWEPAKGENVVDMGIRGLIPTIR